MFKCISTMASCSSRPKLHMFNMQTISTMWHVMIRDMCNFHFRCPCNWRTWGDRGRKQQTHDRNKESLSNVINLYRFFHIICIPYITYIIVCYSGPKLKSFLICLTKFWFWRYLKRWLIWYLSQSSIRPSIYFSSIVISRSNPFLEPTSTKE